MTVLPLQAALEARQDTEWQAGRDGDPYIVAPDCPRSSRKAIFHYLNFVLCGLFCGRQQVLFTFRTLAMSLVGKA